MIWGGYVMGEEEDGQEEEAEEIEKKGEKVPEGGKHQSDATKNTNQQTISATKFGTNNTGRTANTSSRRSSIATNQHNTTTANSMSSLSSTQHRNASIPSQSMTNVNSSQGPRRFEGKVAIVTESNCGIDRATALLLGKEGAKVCIHGTDEDELRRTIIRMMRADIDQENILVVQGTVENDQTLKNLVERTYAKFGQIDILINNAGKITHSANNHHLGFNNNRHNGEEEEDDDSISSGGGGSRLNKYNKNRRRSTFHRNSMFDDSHNFDLLFNINLKSITKLTRLCLPYLEDTKGVVVNVTSFGSQQAFSDYANYSTAKTALDNYCRSIAIKYAKRNIRVNNVNPGFITSESAEDTEVHVNKFYLNWIKNHVPLERGGTAEEIAKVIGFLASDDSSYITGATIVADGAISIFSKPSDFF